MTKLFLCFFAFVSLTGCTTLDMERTYLVENGMTPAEVLDVVGMPPTQVLTTADYTTYLWRDRTFYGNYRSFVVTFDQSGKVIGKDDRAQRISESKAAQMRLNEAAQTISEAYPNTMIRQMPSSSETTKKLHTSKLPR